MQRVMIIGQPGSGKSTLARIIGAETGLPVVHIDQIHWMPGWVERDGDSKIAVTMAEQDKDRWIIEGGLGATKGHRVARCDTLINLDLPLRLRAWRVFKRTITGYGKTRPDLPDNCPERISWEFWRWIWDTRRIGRESNLCWMETAGPDVTVHHLRSIREARAFVASL